MKHALGGYCVLAGFLASSCNGSSTGPTTAQVTLTFTTQPPPSAQGNVTMSPAIQVTVRDASGTPISGAAVTMTVGFSPESLPGSRLAGTLTAVTENGVATFAALRIDEPGTGYTLTATSGSASTSSNPFSVGLTFTGLGAGGLHTCGITAGGTYCWGQNLYGQIGRALGFLGSAVPVLVPTSSELLQFVGGEQHSCGLVAGGATYCWGHNDQDQLGDGVTNGRDQCPGPQFTLLECSLAPMQVVGSGTSPLTFILVSSGPIALHTCGLTEAGAIYCWGHDYAGELGNGMGANSATPVQVTGSGAAPLIFTDVSAGGWNTCGVTTTYAAYCWGSSFGSAVTQVMGSGTAPLTFTAVTVRRVYACGLTTNGAAYCWGDNSVGELGDSTTTNSSVPVLASGSGTAPRVFTSVVGGDIHTCALTTTGAVYCWGHNSSGALGDGTTTTRTVPVQVVGSGSSPLVFTALAGGEGRTCGLTTSHAIYCWGYGLDGGLGNGTMANQLTPVRVIQ